MTVQAEQIAQPWFERWPGLLDWELKRFRDLEIKATVEEEQKDQGRLVISSTITFRDEEIPIRAAYPAEYPELPPMIFGPPGLLDRHQSRFSGSFCLLPRPLDDWPAHDWGAADLIVNRLTALLSDTEVGPERVRLHEASMPEPVSSYFLYAHDAAVLIPEEVAPRGEEGTLRLRQVSPHLLVVEEGDAGSADLRLIDLFPAQNHAEARWTRLEAAPPAGPLAVDVLSWLRREHPGLLSQRPPPPPPSKRRRGSWPRQPAKEICALVFPEEGPGVGETRDAWMFLLIDRSSGSEQSFLVHAQLVSRSERGRRLSDLEGLADRRVLITGLGTLGGPIAVELARAGIGALSLVDCERHEFGNTTRHPLGVEYIGLPKTAAVGLACRRANPFSEVETLDLRLGDPEWSGESSLDRLGPFISAADVVVEATGSHQIAQLLGRLTAETDTPMISAWLTDGFWGGEIVRIVPGRTCCWTCFATKQREDPTVLAEAGPSSEVVVQGCSHPTTIGAGFDATELAAIGTRLVIQTLSPDGAYSDASWDHGAVNFRRDPADPEFPRFSTERLEPRSGCSRCQPIVGAIAVP